MEKNNCLNCRFCVSYDGKLVCKKAHVELLDNKPCKKYVFDKGLNVKETTSISWFEKRFNKIL